jgi:hypothetical protein
MTEKAPKKSNGKLELAGPVHDGDELYFSEEDLSRYELAQYKLANTMQGVLLKKHEMEDFRKKSEMQLGQMQVQIVQLTKMSEKQKNELEALQSALAELYEVDFSKITYDEETGRIQLSSDRTSSPSSMKETSL